MPFTANRALLLAIVICTGGCGANQDQRVSVGGRVLIDGKPLASGTIRFVPETGRPAGSAIRSDGTFELASEKVGQFATQGVSRGKYRIQVSAATIIDDDTIRWNAPEKYADFRTSGLTAIIDGPAEDMVIELSSERENLEKAGTLSTDGMAEEAWVDGPPASKGPKGRELADEETEENL